MTGCPRTATAARRATRDVRGSWRARKKIPRRRLAAAAGEAPGAGETFRRLRQAGVKVALNTGFSRDIAQTLIDRLKWELDELIDASVTSDEVERGRPHPDMIRRLMLKLGVTDPQRVAKVGDTPADLLEGKNAGCGLIVGVTQGSCARTQLERFPHDYLIGSVAELPELLGV